MSKYLEKIDRVISDANVVKSFSFPYVGAVDDENVILSPPQIQNEIVLTPKWNGSRTLSVYMADICDFRLSNSGPNILLYQSVNRRSSVVVPVSVVSEWASRVDEDGYVYVCLDATVGSGISFITEKPVPADPEIIANE